MNKVVQGAALMAIAALGLTGCANGANQSRSDKPKVVTSTDVYADIVKQIAGDSVEVTSLISSTSQDPHSYEATAADRLKVKDADIVLLNGGGYDHFLEDLAGQDNKDQKVINAVETSGLFSADELKELTQGHAEGEHHEHNHGALNEHVWYSFDAMKKVSQALTDDLSETASDHADEYKKADEEFDKKLDELNAHAKEINGKGKNYISTEPVPGYLLQEAGLTDKTPSDLTSAVEDGSDIAPLTLQNVKNSLKDGSVNLLAYNEQTSSNQTQEILGAAKADNVANVSFTETLPEGKDYVDWMNDNVANVKTAVAQ